MQIALPGVGVVGLGVGGIVVVSHLPGVWPPKPGIFLYFDANDDTKGESLSSGLIK